MASSQGSSPANDSMPPSPPQLTPRSKVKAMLAALDENSDSGNSPAPTKRDFSSKPGSTTILSGGLRLETSLPSNHAISADEAESEADEVVFKPRGRIAAAMLAMRNDTAADGDDEGESARDRVRKMLMTAKNGSPKAIDEEGDPGSNGGGDPPVIYRRRKIRRTRESTPKSSLSKANHSSPGGMFVSPTSTKSASPERDGSASADDLPANPSANARFLALVEKKRQERLAKEEEAQRQKAEKAAERGRFTAKHSNLLEDDANEYSDDDGGRRLTQQAHPTRKASKKALEEMHRETQRMSRNMQLAHEARTKKKITKSSLFAKFNYKPAGFVKDEVIGRPRPTSSSSAPQTDAEMKDTPPTSPISHTSDMAKTVDTNNDGRMPRSRDIYILGMKNEEDILSLEDALPRNIASSLPRLPIDPDKGKDKAFEQSELLPLNKSTIEKRAVLSPPPLRIRPPRALSKRNVADNNSDSDLEIVPAQMPVRKTRKESIFDRVPAKQAREPHSLHALRMLAHIKSPGKQAIGRQSKPSMTVTELQMSLQQRARQQAAREREERLQALKDSGVILQTAEEREKEMADLEDLMAKARRDGEEIMRREKDAAKKERKSKGEVDPSGESSDDEEWEEEIVAEQISGSGSESEEDDESDASGEEDLEEDADEGNLPIDEEEPESAAPKPDGALIDDEASESDTAEEAGLSDEETAADFINDGDNVLDILNDDEEEILPIAQARRRTKHLVLSDDEEDQDVISKSPMMPHTDSPQTCHVNSPIAPPSVLRSASKTFIPGLTVAGPAGLGLTQIFAGTMDETQTQVLRDSHGIPSPPHHHLDTAQDSLAFLRDLPATELPVFGPTIDENSQDIVRDSQTQISQIPESTIVGAVSQGVQLQFSQSQVLGFDSMLQNPLATQFSEFPEPTQDTGFQVMSPIKGRFVEPPPSTVDTVLLEQTSMLDHVDESPVAKRKGKLRRRTNITALSDDGQVETSDAVAAENTDEFEIANVFDFMRKTSKRREVVVEFDKKKSAAKEMVHEQAEESEDEYAGLGGASDDESGGEEDAYVKEMIDDEGGKDVDESKLAAFYADKERASDEKQVEKLFKDITNGMLRRKRGANYDLSDSDDDGEARRRMKRKEFAKMRKALLEDERLGKIAENPKKMAFLRAIEDRGDDDEIDFLDDLADPEDATDSQSQSQAENSQQEVSQVNDSQPDIVMGPPKRKLPNDSGHEIRLPPRLRRIQSAKRPSNLAEIRESLSSLIEEPNAIIASHDSSGSDSELEFDDSHTDWKQKELGKENRDPFASRRSSKIAVVDRISMKRAASSAVSTATRLAFAAPSSTPGFKVPALLRRATTNSSITSGSSASSVSGTERMAGGFGDDGKVTKKAGKNSGVHYFARENERKMKVENGEKRREQRRWKGAEGRRKVVKELFGMGKFE